MHLFTSISLAAKINGLGAIKPANKYFEKTHMHIQSHISCGDTRGSERPILQILTLTQAHGQVRAHTQTHTQRQSHSASVDHPWVSES